MPRALTLLGLVLCVALAAPAAGPPAVVDEGYREVALPFLTRHCARCHGPKKALAGFRVDTLGADFDAARVADHWKEVIDRVNAGKMPPEDAPRPDAGQAAAFVAWVNGRLRAAELAARGAGGRIPMRRLNRDEYANTVRDLLHLDENVVRSLVEELPGDGKAEGFDRLGAGLFFDRTQVERTLAAAERIAARAVLEAPPKANTLVNRFEILRLRPPGPRVEVFPSFAHTIPRGAEDRIIRKDFIEYIQGYPTYRREDVGWGAVHHFAVAGVVKQDGYYRFRITARVDNRGRTEKNRFRLQYGMASPIQAETEVPLDPSGVTEAVMFLRGPVDGEVKGPQVFRLLWNHTEKAVIREPKYQALVSRWTALRGKMEQAAAKRAPKAEMDALKAQRDGLEKELNAWKGVANIYNPDMDVEKLPRLQIASIEVTGPVQKEWPPASHKALGFDGRLDEARLRKIFAGLLPRAYRRPASAEEVEAAVSFVEKTRAAGKLSDHEALRAGVQRVLCSPGFVFLQEPAKDGRPRELTGHEMAARLSYFLWSTMPDETLFTAAGSGGLRGRDGVAAQVRRMLGDAKAGQLVRNFAGQWLGVREYDSVQPAAEYREYDETLKLAARQEPYEFFAEVLRKDLPITSFLDSDFVVINERLARHYGIEGVAGAHFRRVAIKPEHHRGGVLGMAGLMTYLADGTRTLPLRRATWVLREIFNDPPNNPPPDAGEIQPNTAGKLLTVRQRLDLHRRDPICASCHAKLDPYGLALENYDAVGRWRERFNGEGFRGAKAPLLDVSGALADGTKFRTLEEYKAGLLKQKEKFARAFSVKMLTYAIGRPVGYADRKVIDGLVDALKKNEYRMRALIQAIVDSEPFRTK